MVWGLRDYGIPPIVWGGDSNCEHEWIEYKRPSGGGHPTESAKVSATKLDIQRIYGYKANFCVKCGAWLGNLGLEPHPQMFIDHLVIIFREVKRVLRKDGTLWLNIGDTYYGGLGWDKKQWSRKYKEGTFEFLGKNKIDFSRLDSGWLQPKQKLMIPERVAIALQEDGWILRNTVIWYKPNHMPSSVKDRLSSAYEYVFLFVKDRKYYFDLDAIREPHKYGPTKFNVRVRDVQKGKIKGPDRIASKEEVLDYDEKEMRQSAKVNQNWGAQQKYKDRIGERIFSNVNTFIKGKNPGDVWTINTEPFSLYWCNKCEKLGKQKDMKCLICGTKVLSHFAIFPTKLVERCLLAGCPKDGIVLDPFMGSGTTCLVAKSVGLQYVGIDIKPEYCKMARERIGDNTEIIYIGKEYKVLELPIQDVIVTDYKGKYLDNPESYGTPRAREARVYKDNLCPICSTEMIKLKRGYYCPKAGCEGRIE